MAIVGKDSLAFAGDRLRRRSRLVPAYFLKQMLLPFDIFRVDADGTHRCACVGTLDGAKSRVREFMEAWPAEYVVVSRATGKKISIERDAAPVKKAEWH